MAAPSVSMKVALIWPSLTVIDGQPAPGPLGSNGRHVGVETGTALLRNFAVPIAKKSS
jgi:hypothetical protein